MENLVAVDVAIVFVGVAALVAGEVGVVVVVVVETRGRRSSVDRSAAVAVFDTYLRARSGAACLVVFVDVGWLWK